MIRSNMTSLKIFRTSVFVIMITATIGCERDGDDPAVITSFEPMSGDYNTEVTIRGKHLISNSGSVYVTFGNSNDATIISSTATEVVAKVPAGATTGKITVRAENQITSSESFTVTAGSWMKKTELNKAVNDFAIFFSMGSKACIHLLQGSQPGSFWVYNSNDNTWSEKQALSTEISPGERSGITAWGTNDKGYILRYTKLYEYDPVKNEWTLKNNLPVAVNGNVINVFYVREANRTYAILNTGAIYSYDPVEDVWGFIQEAPFASSTNSGTRLSLGASTKGYYVIGNQVWSLNPTNNQWSQLPDCPGSIYNDFAFTMDNDLYVGASGDNDFWVYKSSANKWIQKGSLIPYRYWPIYFTLDNKGYVGFGVNRQNDIFIHDLQLYNP